METDSSYLSTWNHPTSVLLHKCCSIRTWIQDSTMMQLFRGVWVHFWDTHTHSTRFNTHTCQQQKLQWDCHLGTSDDELISEILKAEGGNVCFRIHPSTVSIWSDNEIQSDTGLAQHHTEALKGRNNHLHFICTTAHL